MSPVRVLTQFHGGVSDAIRAVSPDVEVVEIPMDGPVDPSVQGDVLLASHRSELLRDLDGRGIQWVHNFGTGVDGIPREVFDGRVLTCSRGAGAGPISEWVLAVMLAYEKRLPGVWLDEPPKSWGWDELGGLAGRCVGVIGLGGIGTEVARKCLVFGSEVVAVRRTDKPSPLPEVGLVRSLDELLARADHVVVAAPATAKTAHLLDRDALAKVKPGVHLVNIARGTLVDQDALRAALDDGRVAMASLDVCEPEPLPTGHWLYDHPKVRLSAHISWSSPALVDRIVELFVENLRRWLDGQPLDGIVDPVEGY